MSEHAVSAAPAELAADRLGYFRWGQVAGKTLVTSDAGDWAFLSPDEFSDLLAARVEPGHPRFEEFQRKGFLRDGLDLDAFAQRLGRRLRHVTRGPQWHVVSLVDGAAQMSLDTVEKVVELALESASPSITFELRGDAADPLANFEGLRRLVETARTRSQDISGKKLTFLLRSDFSSLDDERAEWLIDNDVLVATRLDGPAALHDGNRRVVPGPSHAEVSRWIAYFHRRYQELGRDPRLWQVRASLVVTRATLAGAAALVDEYVRHGVRRIHLRPLDRRLMSLAQWTEVGYGADEYLDFYRQALDHILSLQARGTDISEGLAAIFAAKIVGADDAAVVDLQSPTGAGTSELAYAADGTVYPTDQARGLAACGEPMFALGPVRDLTIGSVLLHPTVRAIASASLLDAQPMCAECWNKPFCGISPINNFATQGDLFGQRPLALECREHMGVSRRVFEILEGDDWAAQVLKGWASADAGLPAHRLGRRAP